MEELNKDLGTGLMLENTGNPSSENNHVSLDTEPNFSDDDDEMALR